MRTFVAATVVASLIATSALAATATAPLAPGKPAGVKHAQDMDDATIAWLVGLGILGGGFALVMSGDSDDNLVNGTVPPTSSK